MVHDVMVGYSIHTYIIRYFSKSNDTECLTVNLLSSFCEVGKCTLFVKLVNVIHISHVS